MLPDKKGHQYDLKRDFIIQVLIETDAVLISCAIYINNTSTVASTQYFLHWQ